MKNFLQNIAKTLHQTYKDKLSGCCIVFPNRRSGLFFNKYLSEITGKPNPAILTINELMQKLSHLQIADDELILIFTLFKIYKKERKTTENFDEFYFWGQMLLNDFDALDKYLVDAKDLFQNLKSLQEIENQFNYLSPEQIKAIKNFWKSFEPTKYTKHQADFISIWSVLYDIYTKFNKELHSKGIAYEGMVYREVADKIKNNDVETRRASSLQCQKTSSLLHYEKIIFIGFNALTRCEEKLFDFLKQENLAEFYWDYDKYYIENEIQEAGLFLRENIKNYPSPNNPGEILKTPLNKKDLTGQKFHGVNSSNFDYLSKKDKHIEFIAVPSEVGQAKIVNQILQKTIQPPNIDTAIVLPDEHLLIPLLYSLPEEIKAINVTMGYPLKDTPAYSLIEHIIELQKNIRIVSDERYLPSEICSPSGMQSNSYKADYSTGRATISQGQFYFRNVLAILNHQYINNEVAKSLVDYINKNNKIYISPDELGKNELLKNIFHRINKLDEIPEYLVNILHNVFQKDIPELEQEYINQFILAIKQLKEIITRQEIPMSIETFFKLLKQIIQTINIPFEGEPLEGLQVMGVLETRALDFENVIILSMNEGILPAGDSASTFIPYNLRKGFGLPTVEHSDAIYAYYFYRLIQRAKNIYLIYNSTSNGRATGEMSRFLYQLKYESGFNILEKNLTFDISLSLPEKINIKKTTAVINKLEQYFTNDGDKKYFSPSAINTYIDCSLKFYFRYIAQLKEPDEVKEEIDAMTFGNLLHKAMNIIYKSYENKLINVQDIENLINNKQIIEDAILKSFEKEYYSKNVSGRNILIFEILKKYILQILHIDKNYTPFQIIELEKEYKIRFPVKLNNKEENINLGGTIDRIDKLVDTLRIIDYKTGKVESSYSDIPSLFTKENINRNKAVLQILFYSMLYEKNRKQPTDITPALYFTKQLFNDNFDYHIKKKQDGKYIIQETFNTVSEEFENELKNVFKEIFNPELDFEQVKNENICNYCPYSGICHRD